MRNISLFNSTAHRVLLLSGTEPGAGEGAPTNPYLILHRNDAVLVDPGGYDVIGRVLDELLHHIKPEDLTALILSSQNPDVAGSITGWLALTRATVYVPQIWSRFMPHYGVPENARGRFVSVPDSGMRWEFARGFALDLLPAHHLHSPGQINVYDPVAHVLFSGAIGSAMTATERNAFVDDFAAHRPNVEPFHRRTMCANHAARTWVKMVSGLRIDKLAPQHGPIYRERAVTDFIEWFAALECGVDLVNVDGAIPENSIAADPGRHTPPK